MLTVSGLKTFYGNSQALFGMTLEVRAGEVATLMGRNGMGKTTTVHSIMGISQSREGDIQYEGCLLYTTDAADESRGYILRRRRAS